MAGMQYQEKTAQENLQHSVMGAVFFVAIKNEAVFFRVWKNPAYCNCKYKFCIQRKVD